METHKKRMRAFVWFGLQLKCIPIPIACSILNDGL